MKKCLIIMCVIGLFTTSVHAENPKGEAIESLSTAQRMIKNGQISKAVEEINYALSKLSEVSASNILQFIPKPPRGFKLINKHAQGLGQGASVVGHAGAEAEYSGPRDSSVTVVIATGGVTGKMGSLANLGSMFGTVGQNGGVKTVRINGYTGTLQFDASSKSGSLTIQVGDKTSVNIDGDGIPNASILKSFARNMDLAKLASVL